MERLAGGAAAGVTALRVQWCHGATVPAVALTQGIGIVGLRGAASREAARESIRAALRAGLATTCGVEVEEVRLDTPRGNMPSAIVGPDNARRSAWLSISHDGDLSIGAFRFDGPIGVDVMRVLAVPDWDAVARDYLGPKVAAALDKLPARERSQAFACAWSEHEARLKCLGRQLGEWQPADSATLRALSGTTLGMPEGYVGYVATTN